MQPDSTLPSAPSGYEWERLWIAPLEGGLYEVRNTPFLAYGLNWGDIVSGTFDNTGVLNVERIERRGGHRTLRIAFDVDQGGEERQSILLDLYDLGATHENMNGTVYSIDVPPEADYSAVFSFLSEAERAGRLTFEIGSDGT